FPYTTLFRSLRRRAPGGPAVVDDDVHSAEVFLGGGHHPLHILRAGDVTGEGQGLSPLLFDRFLHLAAGFHLAGADHHAGTGVRQGLRHVPGQAAPAPGDDGRLSIQAEQIERAQQLFLLSEPRLIPAFFPDNRRFPGRKRRGPFSAAGTRGDLPEPSVPSGVPALVPSGAPRSRKGLRLRQIPTPRSGQTGPATRALPHRRPPAALPCRSGRRRCVPLSSSGTARSSGAWPPDQTGWAT